MGWMDRLGLGTLFGKGLGASFYESLEEALWEADAGPALAAEAVAWLKDRAKSIPPEPEAAKAALRTFLSSKLPPWNPPAVGEGVLTAHLLLGVNGAGKTTTCAKLAARWKDEGVLLGACDTFRAAAREQLAVWAERLQVPLVGAPDGSDAAAVAYDAVASALAKGLRHAVLDTAGRLHTKDQLLDQLAKLIRAVDKHGPKVKRVHYLVLDATQGRAMAAQAKVFAERSGVDALILTKADTGAKAGTVMGIGAELGLPVAWVTVGEGIDDLRPFVAADYLGNLL